MNPLLYASCLLTVAAFTATAGAADTVHIGIVKLAFAPAQVSAHVGDTIEWTNNDFIVHTATARDKGWDVAIPSKGTGRVTLKNVGDIEYYCRFHPNMVGHISVSAR